MEKQIDWDRLETELVGEIDLCQSIIMDSSELILGESKEWPFFRSRTLKAFGDRGLRGRVREKIHKLREAAGRSQGLCDGQQ